MLEKLNPREGVLDKTLPGLCQPSLVSPERGWEIFLEGEEGDASSPGGEEGAGTLLGISSLWRSNFATQESLSGG